VVKSTDSNPTTAYSCLSQQLRMLLVVLLVASHNLTEISSIKIRLYLFMFYVAHVDSMICAKIEYFQTRNDAYLYKELAN